MKPIISISAKIASLPRAEDAIAYATGALDRIEALYRRARPLAPGRLRRPWTCGEQTYRAISSLGRQVGEIKSAAISRGEEL